MRIPSAPFRLVIMLVLCAALAIAQKYTVTDLGVLGGHGSNAFAVNDSGVVVGASQTSNQNSLQHAFVWTAATGMQDIGTLGGDNSSAYGINKAGQVVGCADVNSTTQHAFLWTQSGGMQDLGSLGGMTSCAVGINDNGQVVGYSTVTSNADAHAFIWTASTGLQDMGVPVSGSTIASSINNSGTAVGSYYSGTTGYHAFEWTQSGGVQDLGNLGQPYATAGSINAYGEVVGRSEAVPNTTVAYLWTPQGGMRGLPTPKTYIDATANAVSSRGVIVGFTLTASAEQRATVWPTPTTVHDMNGFTVNSTIILEMANGVNRSGQIVGVGRLKSYAALAHAFLATPTK
jgi:probable HAF family extracellular repeat protein